MKKIIITAFFTVLLNFTMKAQSDDLIQTSTPEFLSIAFKDRLIKLLDNNNTIKLKKLKKESLIKFSINDKFWAVAYSNKIEIYDIEKFTINTIVLSDEIRDITFSKTTDNILAAYSIDGTIKIYNIETKEVKTLFYDNGAFGWSQIKKIKFINNDNHLYFYNDQDESGIYNLTKYAQYQSDITPTFLNYQKIFSYSS